MFEFVSLENKDKKCKVSLRFMRESFRVGENDKMVNE